MSNLTPKEERERERLHRKWATMQATRREMERAMALDQKANAQPSDDKGATT
jgi:hypothetical protein